MKCPNCQKNIPIRTHYCPHCGDKIEVDFSYIASSVEDDLAVQRGGALDTWLKTLAVLLFFAGVVLFTLAWVLGDRLHPDVTDVPVIAPPEVQFVKPADISVNFQWGSGEMRSFQATAPTYFGYRMDPMIKKALLVGNAGEQFAPLVEVMLQRGLRQLASLALPDGSWPVSWQVGRAQLPYQPGPTDTELLAQHQYGKTGVTALALLALLGDGHLWTRPGDPYGELVQRGIFYLLRCQDPRTGAFGPAPEKYDYREGEKLMYNHGMAAAAIIEAYGMSGQTSLTGAAGEKTKTFDLHQAAQSAVNFIVEQQQDTGGWGYFPHRQGRPDSSVTVWQVMALLSAGEAGLRVPPEVFAKARRWNEHATFTLGQRRGLYIYDTKDIAEELPGATQGIGLLAWLALEAHPADSLVQAIAARVRQRPPRWLGNVPDRPWGRSWKASLQYRDDDALRASEFDLYRWYHGTYGMFFLGGKDWEEWNKKLVVALRELQTPEGLWLPNDRYTKLAGLAFAQALACLTLEVYYRYPIHRLGP